MRIISQTTGFRKASPKARCLQFFYHNIVIHHIARTNIRFYLLLNLKAIMAVDAYGMFIPLIDRKSDFGKTFLSRLLFHQGKSLRHRSGTVVFRQKINFTQDANCNNKLDTPW